ncbi:3-oxo-5-alpha-steroid 4-dehydrogenase 1-like [Anneissia japonica]|uniref:3-oxo-5-alpha-steroid 4-dehydrogenase 1-like n=1 Tax=Anneissia japonica TaxID=1529436 RepID=UPI001425AC78|nr:3-oxo-5-alpha-steroid 4-dehydrogenase 1-like [Anneissia japonica]
MLSFLSGQSVAEEQLIFWMAVVMAFLAIFAVFLLQFKKATYGRYSDPAHGKTINVKVAWVLQESPAVLIPLTLLLFTDSVQTKTTVNIILCGLFILHYMQRTLIFPCLIRGGKDTPRSIFVIAIFFCICNGYMQGRYLTQYAEYPSNWISDYRFLFASWKMFQASCPTVKHHGESPKCHGTMMLEGPGENTAYFVETLIFPCLIRGGKDTPRSIFVIAISFCICNGYMQGRYLTQYAEYPSNWISDYRFLFGVCLFFIGMFINLHSDYILRNLRKPGETGYKIPKGGMFNYISGANFFGEIVEWLGFAIAVWSFTAFSFFLFTLCNIGPRACHHHQYYRKKFDDYPKSRKAVIPFIL